MRADVSLLPSWPETAVRTCDPAMLEFYAASPAMALMFTLEVDGGWARTCRFP